jgi:hypothetical protein
MALVLVLSKKDAGDIDLFESVERAAGYLEPWYLDEAIMFDEDGLRFSLAADGPRVRAVPDRPAPDDLARMLAATLDAHGFSHGGADLRRLVQIAKERYGLVT